LPLLNKLYDARYFQREPERGILVAALKQLFRRETK
jgi:hypothetical protein